MGEIDGAFRAWGIPKGGTGGVSYAIARAAQALGAEIRTEAPVARIIVRNGRATGVALESRRGDRGVGRPGLHRREGHLPRPPRARHAGPRVRAGGPPLQVPRQLGQGQPRRRPPAGLHLPAGRGRAPARRHLLQPHDPRDGAGLRRREVRALEQPPVHRHDHPDPRRPADGAAGQARDQLLRPVRAVQAGARARAPGTTTGRRSATRSSTGSRSSRRTSATSSSAARSSRRSTSSGRWASPRGTSSRASSASSSCSSTGRSPGMPASGPRCRTSGSRARRPTRAAA